MKKIVPHLWFDTQAKEATAFYASLFPNSRIDHLSVIRDTPSGDCDIVKCTLLGQPFMAISAGPYFTFNPSISFSVSFNNEVALDTVWNSLVEGGEILMPLMKYPWSPKYGWLKDRYGLSWQLSMDAQNAEQKIIPSLLFTKERAGKAKDAISFYTSIFENSKTEILVPYEKGENDVEGYVKFASFTLLGQQFIAMDSSASHDFTFNEAISFVVHCDTQEEIDYYWSKLSAEPEAEQCGWLKDQYGVSWQIVPTLMDEMMTSGDQEKVARVTQAFLKMKKFNIQELKRAYENN